MILKLIIIFMLLPIGMAILLGIYYRYTNMEVKGMATVDRLLKERLKDLIFNYNFEEAKDILNVLNEKKQVEIVTTIAFDTGNILIYTFLSYLILEYNTSFRHSLAAGIMSSALCYIEGAYETAFYHARKASELSPNDVELKEFLLFFHVIPEKLLSKEEAIKIATEILETKKNSKAAKGILKEI